MIFLFLYFTCAITQNVSAQYFIREDVEGVFPEPSEGKAMVIFARLPFPGGGVYYFRVYDAENLIGILRKQTYFAYETIPGKHLFNISSVGGRHFAFLEADLLEGKKYFILGDFATGGNFFIGWNKVALYPIKPQSKNWKSLMKLLSRCNLIETAEEAYQWDKEKYEEVKARREKYYEEWLKETKKHVINPEDGI
jgi:hypothetical protein